MKNFVFLILLFAYINSGAQSNFVDFDCNVDTTGYCKLFTKSSQECYNTVNYIPDEFTDIKYVKVNIHFMLLEEGTTGYPGNFTETYDGVDINNNYNGYDYANDLIDMANYRLSLNQQMNLPPENNTSVLEKKYRYILDAVYFHRNNSYYYFPSYPMGLYGENKGAVVNVFFNNADGNSGGGHANMSGDRYTEIKGAWEGYSFVLNDPNYSLDDNLWVVAFTINHEIGHNLGLLHTIRFSSGPCCNTCDDGCDDTPIRQEMLNLGFDPCCGWGGGSISTCSNNMMDYSGSGALTPCQLGKIHYTLMYSMENYLIKDYCNYDLNQTIYISEPNIVWNSSKNLLGNLIIEESASLTIKCKISLPQNGRVIVKPGAKLVIDGGIITNSCGDMWQGIELWGNKNESQYTSGAQGKIILKNGAVIENSIDAIKTIKTDNGVNDLTYTGGIIQANDAIFKNNKNGIWFGPYHNSHPYTGAPMSNAGHIKNCTFETTEDYIDISNPPYEFIGLYDVDGISIYGNTFRNTNTDYTGNGIMSYDANYNVKPLCISPLYPCTEFQPNIFENLHYAIYANNSNNFIPVTINGNNFDNNFRSITLRNINNATVTENNLKFNTFFG